MHETVAVAIGVSLPDVQPLGMELIVSCSC
jgi:hypothetical protein